MRWIFFTRIFISLLAVIFIISIAFSIDNEKSLFVIGILVSIIFSFIIAAVISAGISNEIKSLNDAAKKLASGDFNTRAILSDKGKLREVADSFNQMVERMGTIFSDLSAKTEN